MPHTTDAAKPNPARPDQGKRASPARAFQWNGTFENCRNASTLKRQNLRWRRTRSVPTERTSARRQATSNDRANQAGPYQRITPPAKASFRSSYSSLCQAPEPREPASTGLCIDTTPHTEQGLVPPERHSRSTRSSTTSHGGPRFASTTLAHTARTRQRAEPAKAFLTVRAQAVLTIPPESGLHRRINEPAQARNSTRPGRHRTTREPEFVNRSIMQTSAQAHRRSVHAVYLRSVKPELGPAFLGWLCVAAHSRICHPQIETGRGSRLGSVGLNWVCLWEQTDSMPNKCLTGIPERPQTGSRRRAHVELAQSRFVATGRASHPRGGRAVRAARNQRAEKAKTRPTVGRATTERIRPRSDALTQVKVWAPVRTC